MVYNLSSEWSVIAWLIQSLIWLNGISFGLFSNIKFNVERIISKLLAWSVYIYVSKRGIMNMSNNATTITFFNVTSPITRRILLYLFSIYSNKSTSSKSFISSIDFFLWISSYWISSSDKCGKFIFGVIAFGELPTYNISSGWILISFKAVFFCITIPSWSLFKTLPIVSSSIVLFC